MADCDYSVGVESVSVYSAGWGACEYVDSVGDSESAGCG